MRIHSLRMLLYLLIAVWLIYPGSGRRLPVAYSQSPDALYLPAIAGTYDINQPVSTPSPTPIPQASVTITVLPTVTATGTPSITATPTGSATATGTPAMSVMSVGSGSIEPGAQVAVLVEVTALPSNQSLGTLDLDIAYNAGVVRPVSCQDDPQNRLDISLCNTEPEGVIHLSALSTAGVAQTPIQIALITFQAVGQAGQTTALDLQVTTFMDSSGNNLSVVATNGEITIRQPTGSGPTIGVITTNLASYPNSQVPRHEKLELTFDLSTVATNLQLPYDASPPPGLQPGIGVSVDALFTPDNWQTTYTQPAFYYQNFLYEIKSGQEWMYPTDNFDWKIRFTPDQTGLWQYKIRAEDASGITETAPQSFTVSPSTNKGFIRVSERDSRYFEHEDGTYFPGLGFNMNYDHVGWVNPVIENQENFQIMGENGIQLIRIWLSQWAIYGSEWNPWMSPDPALHGGYLPHTGSILDVAMADSEASMLILNSMNPCMFIGTWKAHPATLRNTDYRIRIRYKAVGITGPRIAGKPYGFVAKTGGWLWEEGHYCHDPGIGALVTPYQSQDTDGWEILEGTLNSGSSDFLPNFFLVQENATAGHVYIDHVWIEEVQGSGQSGPNIVSKPWMAHHLYMEQRNSYAFDKLLELAEQNNIYLRPVIHEKSDGLLNSIDFEGNPILYDPLCYDQDPDNDPAQCRSNDWFYGNGRNMTKVRWLQKAWWRYLQARWGYSPNIHSWELLNEGDPWNEAHYVLADEFAKYMHQFKPNDHLVSTSMWHSFPRDQFWANANYPNIDFADIHLYIGESDPLFNDTALSTYDLSMQIGAKQSGGIGKPVIRGETGFVEIGSEPATTRFDTDSNALWLHNFIWGGINAGGLIESYWYETTHIYKDNSDGSYAFDHRSKYRTYYNFIAEIPLSNGHYQDAEATANRANLRAWGQKDLVNGCAHLWIQNAQHTWNNVVDGVAIVPISGSVSITGFTPNTNYAVQQWDTYQPDKSRQIVETTQATSQPDGIIVLTVNNLAGDYAVKIISATGCN